MTVTADTRTRILDAALACFLELGYDGTTVAKIRERSGVSNGALFHHFRSKEMIAATLFVDAIKDFQQGGWRILESSPGTLEEGVRAIVAHHLAWVEANPDRARFLYAAGQLDGSCEPMQELGRINTALTEAYAAWYRPLVERGEARPVRAGLVVAIVAGPAHAVCQHWLNGARKRPLTRHTDELAHAAWAGLAGPAALGGAVTGVPHPPAAAAPPPARIRVEVLDADGAVIGHTDTPLEQG